MNCLAVLDTNVLVSALISKAAMSPPVKILEMALSGELTLIYSDEIIAEYDTVLRRRKFNQDNAFVDELLAFIKENGLCVNPESCNVPLPDIKDLPFYEVVMEKRDDGAYLVTGNTKHFPCEPFIITPREFIERITQE